MKSNCVNTSLSRANLHVEQNYIYLLFGITILNSQPLNCQRHVYTFYNRIITILWSEKIDQQKDVAFITSASGRDLLFKKLHSFILMFECLSHLHTVYNSCTFIWMAICIDKQ